MSKSLSAMERGNPPPRRKSCAACIKAKRRCTLEIPACLRCSQRQLDCKYAPGSTAPKKPAPRHQYPAHNIQEQLNTTITAKPATNVALEMHIPSIAGEWTMAANLGIGMEEDNLPLDLTSHPPPLDSCSISMTDLLLEDISRADGDNQHASQPMEGMSTSESTPPGLTVSDATALGQFYMPLSFPLDTPQHQDFVQFALKTRLQYAIDKITAASRQMVTENQTPWCHPHLYEFHMPRSMEDAQSSCALYMAKNPVNSQVILRAIDNRARELGASPMPRDALEILARTQALLLYHIMRLFDSDIRARSTAEAATQQLEDAADALALHPAFGDSGTIDMNNDGTTPTPADLQYYSQYTASNKNNDSNSTTSVTDPPPPVYLLNQRRRKFWDAWVFQESARRTWMIVFFLGQMYRLIKGNVPLQCDGKLTLHPFTLSAHLWMATDALGFATAWRTKEHFFVRNANFCNTFDHANGDDIDVFGKILITTLIGIDETKHWLRTRGGDL
ncbi:hypothetical protein B0H66DRAFT_253510 [Apodospora peruviana]|uniref:Zn(2)-C6 fungal-type domain-containing protein n=1 Tax=Apodospora peruviana TaxID=516989 RepID=A0AAE0M4S2_9PEZI|nr:hypothetical protein B0H66DRAFT_253510 [Apodospora peruviana]